MKIYSILLSAIFFLFIISIHNCYSQKKSLTYNLNERPTDLKLKDINIEESKSPFIKFVGEWTLKEENWSQNWGNGLEEIKIPNHHTICTGLNTDNSLLAVIDGTPPNGHIFWSYNPIKKIVHHLSSFGESRSGTGEGTVNENGDITLKVSFEGEPEGTYRIYTYKWVTDNEYDLMSIQFNAKGEPTGNFYGGTFIRINKKKSNKVKDIESIKSILKVLDDNNATMQAKLDIWVDDLVHMAPNNKLINNKTDLSNYLENQNEFGYSDMEHQIIEVFPYEDIVLMRGRVLGLFYQKNNENPTKFRTKNLFVFRRQEDNHLKIWKVIYNMSPNE